jgi:hypothetical protein
VGYEPLTSRHTLGTAVASGGVALAVTLGSGASVSVSDAKGPLIVLGAPVAEAALRALRGDPADGCLEPRRDGRPPSVRASEHGRVGRGRLARRSRPDRLARLSSTLGAYVAWTKALEAIGPARASVWASAVPPLAVVIAAVTFGETITPWFAAGAALVIGGVVLAQRAGGLARRTAAAARSRTREVRPAGRGDSSHRERSGPSGLSSSPNRNQQPTRCPPAGSAG